MPRIIFDFIDGATGDEYLSYLDAGTMVEIESSDGLVRRGFITDLPMLDDNTVPLLSKI